MATADNVLRVFEKAAKKQIEIIDRLQAHQSFPPLCMPEATCVEQGRVRATQASIAASMLRKSVWRGRPLQQHQGRGVTRVIKS